MWSHPSLTLALILGAGCGGGVNPTVVAPAMDARNEAAKATPAAGRTALAPVPYDGLCAQPSAAVGAWRMTTLVEGAVDERDEGTRDRYDLQIRERGGTLVGEVRRSGTGTGPLPADDVQSGTTNLGHACNHMEGSVVDGGTDTTAGPAASTGSSTDPPGTSTSTTTTPPPFTTFGGESGESSSSTSEPITGPGCGPPPVRDRGHGRRRSIRVLAGRERRVHGDLRLAVGPPHGLRLPGLPVVRADGGCS